MRKCAVAIMVGVGVILGGAHAHAAGSVPAPLPTKLGNFRLPDHTGSSVELKRYRDSKAVVLYFSGVGCPVVRKSVPRLKEIRDAYAPKGVQFFVVDSNVKDALADIQKEASEYKLDIPVLLDREQIAAHLIGVKSTAEVAVIDPNGWNVVYRGAVDDRLDVGAEKPTATHNWLVDALEALLNGQPVKEPVSEARGCLITIEEYPKEVSYARDIAPVLAAKCQSCHSEGNIGPFSFKSYDDVKNRARMIGEVVRTSQMPPWDADPAFGHFKNDRSLTSDELKKLLSWLDQGAPKDDGNDVLATSTPAPMEEWPLGKPDLIIELDEKTLPAKGVFDYEYVEKPTGLNSDRWVSAVYVAPGNKQVMHHILMFIEYPTYMKHIQPDQQGGLEGFFGGYVPGMGAQTCPEGTAKYLPGRSKVIFQMHYNATGKEEKVKPKVGLYFAKEPPKVEFETKTAKNTDFLIPPNDPNLAVQATHTIDKDVILYAMSPHMHFRGSWAEYSAVYPDGKKEILLSVPQYKFDWQTRYELAEPKTLPAGTKIEVRGGFDNTARNPFNPDPKAYVQFGEQTFEEMFIAYMDYTEVPKGKDKVASAQESAKP
jgi:peroxiredoxin